MPDSVAGTVSMLEIYVSKVLLLIQGIVSQFHTIHFFLSQDFGKQPICQWFPDVSCFSKNAQSHPVIQWEYQLRSAVASSPPPSPWMQPSRLVGNAGKQPLWSKGGHGRSQETRGQQRKGVVETTSLWGWKFFFFTCPFFLGEINEFKWVYPWKQTWLDVGNAQTWILACPNDMGMFRESPDTCWSCSRCQLRCM